MKPVFLSLKEFDATCDKRYGMQNEILMENAARGMCDEILNILKRQTKNKKKDNYNFFHISFNSPF